MNQQHFPDRHEPSVRPIRRPRPISGQRPDQRGYEPQYNRSGSSKNPSAAHPLYRRWRRFFCRLLLIIVHGLLWLREQLACRPIRRAAQAALVLILLTAVLAVWQAGADSALADAGGAGTEDEVFPAATELAMNDPSASDPVSLAGMTGDPAAVSQAAPSPTGKPTAIANTVIPTATTFQGIAPAITSRWVFPLKIEPYTPTIGVFGAARTSNRLHGGIDLYADPGTPVYAMTAGKVKDVLVFYENLMAVDVANADGTTIRYGELAPAVKIGDTVARGDLIGKLRRNSGGTCMLHLEIYATVSAEDLTQVDNKKNYSNVPVGSKSYRRRWDLVDPSAVYSLDRLDA